MANRRLKTCKSVSDPRRQAPRRTLIELLLSQGLNCLIMHDNLTGKHQVYWA